MAKSSIKAIVGPPGYAKTLLSTYYASITTREILSNYTLYEPNSNYTVPLHNYKELNLEDLITDSDHKRLAIVDEIYQYADSRNSQNIWNILLSYATFQHRKVQTDIIVTAQIVRVIDVRIREMCDVIICALRADPPYLYAVYNKDPRTHEFIYTKQIMMKFHQAERVYKYYKTRQLIVSDRTRRMVANASTVVNKDKMLDKHLILCKEYLDERNWEVTRDTVAEYLDSQKDAPNIASFAKSLYLHLKPMPKKKMEVED